MSRIYVPVGDDVFAILESRADKQGMSVAALASEILEKELLPKTNTINDLVSLAKENAEVFSVEVQQGKQRNVPKTAQEFLNASPTQNHLDRGEALQLGLRFKKMVDANLVSGIATYWRDEENRIPYANANSGGRLYCVVGKPVEKGDFYLK